MACDFELPPRIKLDHGAVANCAETSGDSRGTCAGASSGKKGQPWTESEHLGFLAGLKKLGKGNWRGISRLFVPSRTPTQVASHAQKHFLRVSGVTKRRSRFSTLDQAVSSGPAENIHSLAGAPFTAHVAAQAGAQSILEAAALASNCSRASPDFGAAYAPAAVPSGTVSDYNQALTSGSSDYPAWRAVPAYFGAARGSVTAVPHGEQSQPFHFTKICRPTAYRASVRNGEVQKLVRLLAAASASHCSPSDCGQLQQSSQSAFKTIKPQQAVEA